MYKLRWTFGQELAVGIAIALWLAIASWPYIYYTFLRWAVSLAAIYLGYRAYQGYRFGWVISFATIAILFNPLNPIYLSKSSWIFLDIVISLFFLVASYAEFIDD